MAESPRSWIADCAHRHVRRIPLKPKWTARMMAAPVGVPGCSVMDERTARVTVVSVNESGALDLDLPTTRRARP